MDEVEKLVNGGGSGEVSNVDGTASSSVGGTESNLEGSRRILRLCLIGSQIKKDGTGCSVETRYYLEVAHLVVVWKSPHSPQNVHCGKTHAQHVIAETEIWGVGVGADGGLNLLRE